jgi:hypothetical protein
MRESFFLFYFSFSPNQKKIKNSFFDRFFGKKLLIKKIAILFLFWRSLIRKSKHICSGHLLRQFPKEKDGAREHRNKSLVGKHDATREKQTEKTIAGKFVGDLVGHQNCSV